jgi:hypothetical protein
MVDNVVYWSYYSTGELSGQSRGTRITVAELYESRRKNEKYNKYIPTSFSNLEHNGLRLRIRIHLLLHKHISSIIPLRQLQQLQPAMELHQKTSWF